MSQPHILVVEDENVARRVLHAMLVHAGYDVTSVGSGEEAIELLHQRRFDVLLTDLQLQQVSGVEVMATARERDQEIEVIVLTGYATLESAIAAVRHGAFNYILKPGKPGEIEASIAEALGKRRSRAERSDYLRQMGQTLMRMAEGGMQREVPLLDEDVVRQLAPVATAAPAEAPRERPSDPLVHVGNLVIDLQRHLVTQEGKYVQLSSGEFSLLAYLAQRNEQVISPQQLVREVLGYDCSPQEARDLIKARIWSLRRKIEADPADPRIIVSVRGVGYVLTTTGRGA
ncbi:MAG: response regulator transcription factor [Chloroflexaceae bacterium]|jgi:DNA-binding response OmpR family regulator|nr:response regulator transcription factor [Chloroflexaceae bacterium]